MEENIPYRKLRALKHHCISHTSQSLLKSIPRHINQDRSSETIMSQNVAQYSFMLSNSQVKSGDIKWATNLRQRMPFQSKQNKMNSSEIPSVFYKNTQLQKFRSNSENNHGINIGLYSQFFGRESKNICSNSVQFLGKLRTEESKEKSIYSIHPHLFYNYPSKQNTKLPRLLKKDSIKKLKNITYTDYQQNLDGTHKYPPYTYKIFRQKNSNIFSSLIPKSNKINLPSLAWQVSLRAP